jgi:transposase
MAVHLATDERGMPLGATVTGAAANDGQQTENVLRSMVIQPPAPEQPASVLDPLNLPSAKADGAYGNAPTTARATAAGFRMRAPKRGQARLKGVGRIRCAVERGHAFLSQFGRIVRRYDRCARRYLGWVELAACVIFVRSGFVR